LDGTAVRIRELPGVVAELRTPVRVGASGRRLQDEARAVARGGFEIWLEIVAQGGDARVVLQQVERGEAGEVQPLVEHQRGLEAAVRQEQAISQLRQVVTVQAHGIAPSGAGGSGAGPSSTLFGAKATGRVSRPPWPFVQ